LKRNVILVLVVLLCFSVVWAQENENSYKPLFSFSAYGGMMRGEFALNYEFLYNQKFQKWGIQVTTMANINKSIREYGFSAGGWRQFETKFGTMGLGLFFDALNLEKVPMYGYAGFHGQIRPEFRMLVESDLVISFFYAHPFTKDYLLEKTVSKPYFWQDDTGYYYDIVQSRILARAVRYFGASSEMIVFKFLKLKGEGIYSPFEKDDFYRLKIGAEFKISSWLALSGEWMKMNAKNALGLMGGNYQSVRFGAIVHLGRSQEYKFSNLAIYDVITPQYPAVVTEFVYQRVTTNIAPLLKAELTVDPQSVCLGKPINYKFEYSGGTAPYTVYVDFKDGTGSDQAVGQHTYAKIGTYCIQATVKDSSGHSATDCKCITVMDCRKDVTLTVILCEGVAGKPEAGIYKYKEGDKVNYGHGLQQGYINIRTTLDGTPVDTTGTIIMDKDHTLRVCADKECQPVKIISFIASKTVINKGESITLSWSTENATRVTLDDKDVALNGSKVVKPGVTVNALDVAINCPTYVTYTLRAYGCSPTVTRSITITVN